MGEVVWPAAWSSARRALRRRAMEEGKSTSAAATGGSAQVVPFTGIRCEYLPGHPLHEASLRRQDAVDDAASAGDASAEVPEAS